MSFLFGEAGLESPLSPLEKCLLLLKRMRGTDVFWPFFNSTHTLLFQITMNNLNDNVAIVIHSILETKQC